MESFHLHSIDLALLIKLLKSYPIFLVNRLFLQANQVAEVVQTWKPWALSWVDCVVLVPHDHRKLLELAQVIFVFVILEELVVDVRQEGVLGKDILIKEESDVEVGSWSVELVNGEQVDCEFY